MADYSIIADVSGFIAKHLRERMCPSPIPSPDNIRISSPTEQEVDYLLGIYLYDIREEGEIAALPFRRNRQMKLQKEPSPYALYYMVYINGSSQMGLRAPDTQKIIGRAAQIINDHASAEPGRLQPWLQEAEPVITLTASKISFEDKVRVWQAINRPYEVSLFYKAAPILLSSEITMEVPEVLGAEFNVSVIKGQGGTG